MSRDAKISFDWADDHYEFRLAIGQLRELQEKCNAGPAEILTRLRTGTWRVDEVREIIRLGLIGAGKTPSDALKIVRIYVEARPWMESIQPAQVILMAALLGSPEEPVGKKERSAKTKTKAT